MLREELQLLQEQGSYVGEIVKAMDKKKVLVKVNKYKILKYITYKCVTWAIWVIFGIQNTQIVAMTNKIDLIRDLNYQKPV